jgi:hypothetical protein
MGGGLNPVIPLLTATQSIVIEKINFTLKTTNFNVCCIFQYFSSLSTKQNGVTTATAIAATGRNGPLVPHMRPCTLRRCIEWMGDNPLSLRMYFGGGLRVCMALKVLICSGNNALPQHWSVLRAIHTLNSPKNYICLLRGLSTIHSMHWI